MSLTTLASYPLAHKRLLTVLKGSVLEFGANLSQAAIVNAANTGCLGGGGVDGAVTSRGGEQLAVDRMNLPELEPGIRCWEGGAVRTSHPNNQVYGELHVSHVIHAVGPNLGLYEEEEIPTGLQYLRQAYAESLAVAHDAQLEHVAFSLLSAGVFRGPCQLDTVLQIGVQAIREWSLETTDSTVGNIYLCGFTDKECTALLKVCQEELGAEITETTTATTEAVPETASSVTPPKGDESKQE